MPLTDQEVNQLKNFVFFANELIAKAESNITYADLSVGKDEKKIENQALGKNNTKKVEKYLSKDPENSTIKLAKKAAKKAAKKVYPKL